jgi:hypothetical protein
LAVEGLEETDLADGCNLCERCAARFLDWLLSGNPDLAAVDGSGGAINSTAVGIDGLPDRASGAILHGRSGVRCLICIMRTTTVAVLFLIIFCCF